MGLEGKLPVANCSLLTYLGSWSTGCCLRHRHYEGTTPGKTTWGQWQPRNRRARKSFQDSTNLLKNVGWLGVITINGMMSFFHESTVVRSQAHNKPCPEKRNEQSTAVSSKNPLTYSPAIYLLIYILTWTFK